MRTYEPVVVTGMGAVTPLGHDIEHFWAAIKAGKSGVGPITKFDASEYSVQIAGEVKEFDPSDLLDRRSLRGMAEFTIYAAHAALQAYRQAGLRKEILDPYRTGVYIGNGIGGFEVVEENLEKLIKSGPQRVAPLTIPKLIANEAAGNIAILLGAKGPAHTTVTACASGTDAIGEAFHAIRHGIVDCAITGGTEAAITRLAVAGFSRLHALAADFNDRPTEASRPFDKDRSGFVMGEGSGMLILESLSHAQKRGATILGEIVGYSMNCDAYHITAPDPEGDGAARAIKAALTMAGVGPEAVEYINAHGTSTQVNDPMESEAIRRVFGEHAYQLKVSSTKSMTSHLIGAAGAVEAIVCLLALRDQYIPATINLEEPGEGCDLDYVPQVGIEASVEYAMSNSLGFGGHNGVLLFKRYHS